jgi:hypothetical protein
MGEITQAQAAAIAAGASFGGAPPVIAQASAAGVATDASRSDHTHGAGGPPTPVALTDAATIATALLSSQMNQEFQVTLGGNRTMGVPTNPTDGQVYVYRLKNDTGARTVTWTTGAGGFLFGLSIPLVNVVLGTGGANSYDYIAWKYNAALNRHVCVGALLGYI